MSSRPLVNEDYESSSPVLTRALVSTKLYPPRIRESSVHRQRLVDFLNYHSDRRLTIISAPAGFGKSTLAAQWLQQVPIPSAWVTLDENDNHLWSFFRIIATALRSLDESLLGDEGLLFGAKTSDQSTAAFQDLMERLSETTRPFILVLDDFHVIESVEIFRSVSMLLQNLPRSMKLVILSRTEPQLHLARMRASGDIVQLGQNDLMFDQTESTQLLQTTLGLNLTPHDAEIVHQRTEGWVAALNLVGVALRGLPQDRVSRFAADFSGNVAHVDTYLWEEALERLPEDLRLFLMQTSILDRFTSELCDAVTGGDGSAAMIQLCEQRNLFLFSLDDKGQWFRFHHLLSEALRERLFHSRPAEEIDALHRRAAVWLEAQGQVDDAIRHAIAGHDWVQAIPLLEAKCEVLFHEDRVVELRTWLDGIPSAVLEKHPLMAFWLAWAIGRVGRWSDATWALRIAEEAWTGPEHVIGQSRLLLWRSCEAMHRHEYEASVKFGEEALATMPPGLRIERSIVQMIMGIAYVGSGNPRAAEKVLSELRREVDVDGQAWLRSVEMVHSAAALVQGGELHEASQLCLRANRIAGEWPTEIWIQGGLSYQGEIYLEWNQLEEAQECMRRADQLAELTTALAWRPRIRTNWSRIAWARGEAELAHDEIESAAEVAVRLDSGQEIREARAIQARYWLTSNQVALARRWAEARKFDLEGSIRYEEQIENLTYIRLLIRDGRAEVAQTILERIRRQIEEFGRSGELVEVSMLEALVHKELGDIPAAMASLRTALELGYARGYLRTFVDEGEAVASLLRHATARTFNRAYVNNLLSAMGDSGLATSTGHAGSVDALTERELEVLHLVAAGLANREIGQRLFISDMTVKKHLSNILGKLESANRTQAVDQARRMGLI